jgi:transposase
MCNKKCNNEQIDAQINKIKAWRRLAEGFWWLEQLQHSKSLHSAA